MTHFQAEDTPPNVPDTTHITKARTNYAFMGLPTPTNLIMEIYDAILNGLYPMDSHGGVPYGPGIVVAKVHGLGTQNTITSAPMVGW